ncbi:MAG: MBL fold metallo-hydrolase [Chloroflexota bacterium]
MRIRFLGTGAAEGVPAINCDCDHCTRARREGGKLARERSAVLFSLPGYELLVDAPPNILDLLARNQVTRLDGIFLTHHHYDHSAGLEEFIYWRKDLDLQAEPKIYSHITNEEWAGRLGEVAFHIPSRPGLAIYFDGFFTVPFGVHHSVPCFGLAFHVNGQKIVYTSDGDSRVSNYARRLILGADLLMVNTPFFANGPAAAHLDVGEAIALKERVGATRMILTHINHLNRPHDQLEQYLRQFPGVTVAYDGLEIEL